MIKGSPDQEAAKMFIDFVLSKKGQESGQTVGSYQFLTKTTAQAPALADESKDTKLIDYDLDCAGKVRSELVEKGNNAIK